MLLLPTYLPESFGGAEQQTRKLANALARQGLRVTILAPRLQETTPLREQDGKVSVIRFPLSHAPNLGGRHSASFIAWCVKVTGWLVRHRNTYDVLHVVHGRLHAVPAALVQPFVRKPVVIKLGRGGEHFDITVVRKKWLYGRVMAPLILKCTDAWVSNSSEITADLRAAGVPDAAVHAIPNGVEIPPLAEPANRPAIEFLYFGRFDEEKGLDVMLRGFTAACQGAPAGLRLVGSGPCEAQLRGLAAELGIESQVRFDPPVDGVSGILAEADFYVSTSFSEGQSNAMLEAMSHAVPPVVSLVSGTSDAVRDGANGVTFEPGSVEAFAAAVRRAMALSPVQRAAMGAAARATMERDFSIDRVAERNADLYRQLLVRARAAQ